MKNVNNKVESELKLLNEQIEKFSNLICSFRESRTSPISFWLANEVTYVLEDILEQKLKAEEQIKSEELANVYSRLSKLISSIERSMYYLLNKLSEADEKMHEAEIGFIDDRDYAEAIVREGLYNDKNRLSF